MVSCKARQEFAGTTRASPARLQNIWQSVIATIWLTTATTARLGAVGLWMDWQQNVRLLFRQRKKSSTIVTGYVPHGLKSVQLMSWAGFPAPATETPPSTAQTHYSPSSSQSLHRDCRSRTPHSIAVTKSCNG